MPHTFLNDTIFYQKTEREDTSIMFSNFNKALLIITNSQILSAPKAANERFFDGPTNKNKNQLCN
jgi:hypothetical protein